MQRCICPCPWKRNEVFLKLGRLESRQLGSSNGLQRRQKRSQARPVSRHVGSSRVSVGVEERQAGARSRQGNLLVAALAGRECLKRVAGQVEPQEMQTTCVAFSGEGLSVCRCEVVVWGWFRLDGPRTDRRPGQDAKGAVSSLESDRMDGEGRTVTDAAPGRPWRREQQTPQKAQWCWSSTCVEVVAAMLATDCARGAMLTRTVAMGRSIVGQEEDRGMEAQLKAAAAVGRGDVSSPAATASHPGSQLECRVQGVGAGEGEGEGGGGGGRGQELGGDGTQ